MTPPTELQSPPADQVTRRGFLKGVGGIVGAAALTPVLLDKAGAQTAPATRSGVRMLAAEGAKLTLKVNGQARDLTINANTTLLDALREKCELTGAKEVCSRGACGACTVMIDGKSVNSCLMLAADAVGKEITTVEGLVKDGVPDPVQKAFAENDACQCGYCIPGFVVRSRAFLNETPNPSLADIKHGLVGNICRCAAYVRIFEAVGQAAKGGAA